MPRFPEDRTCGLTLRAQILQANFQFYNLPLSVSLSPYLPMQTISSGNFWGRTLKGRNKRRVLGEEEAGGGETTARMGEVWPFEALMGGEITYAFCNKKRDNCESAQSHYISRPWSVCQAHGGVFLSDCQNETPCQVSDTHFRARIHKRAKKYTRWLKRNTIFLSEKWN